VLAACTPQSGTAGPVEVLAHDQTLSFPIAQDLTSDDGRKTTGAVVQYAGDGSANNHYIFQQLDQVKYQYGCFFATYLKNGTATIPAPAALGTPCPGM